MHEEQLTATLPRYIWYKVEWKPSMLASIWSQIWAKRRGEACYEDVLDVKLREGKFQAAAHTAPQGVKQANQTCKKRVGPCHFGCTTTYKNRHGNPKWKAVPYPSPWEGIEAAATLCERCYGRAQRTRKALAMADSSFRSTDERRTGTGCSPVVKPDSSNHSSAPNALECTEHV